MKNQNLKLKREKQNSLNCKNKMLNFWPKLFVGSFLLYATYINFTCPCDIHLSCHLFEFFGSLGMAMAGAVYLNFA